MKKIIFILGLFLATAQTSFGQCNFTIGDNWTNLTSCTNATVSGLVSLSYPSSGGGTQPCPNSGAYVYLQRNFGAGGGWSTQQSIFVSTGFGSASYSFNISTSGEYRITASPISGSSCSGCGFSNVTKTSRNVTINKAPTANFQFNGVDATTSYPITAYGFGCPNKYMTFTHTSTGTQNSSQWKLYYQECNSIGTGLTGTIHGLSAWNNGWPSSSYDFSVWGSGFMGTASAIGKYYLVTLELKNGCNSTPSVKKCLVYVSVAPSTITGNIQIASLSGGCSSSSFSNPCVACDGGAAFSFNSVTGIVLSYIRKVDKWQSGTWVNVFNDTTATLGAPTGIVPIAGTGVLQSGFIYRLTVKLCNNCGCSADMVQFFSLVTCKKDEVTSIGPDAQKLKFSVFPNPASENITILLPNDKSSSLSVFNFQGQLVHHVDEVDNSINHVIDIAEWQSGIYFIQVDFDGERIVQKFSKQ